MRTNLNIDGQLMDKAMLASGLPTKKATIEEALRLLIQQSAQRKALNELWGSGWDGNLNELREAPHPSL